MHALRRDGRPALGARSEVSLERWLTEWAKWAKQGNSVGIGYPSEACTESLALPFKRCDTTEDQCEDFESSHAADELIGIRLDEWVASLYEPMRTVIRFHYVHMPEDDKRSAESLERYQERRARLCAIEVYKQAMRRYEKDGGKVPVWSALTADQYDSARLLAMDLLRDIQKRWAGGV